MNKFFSAVLFGYLLGLLTAPKKGKEMRAELSENLKTIGTVSLETLDKLQNHGMELADKAAPAVEQIKIEGQNLKQEGEEMAKNAKEVFNDSYERGVAALEQAEQRIKEKAAPAMALVKEDANTIKTQGSEFLKNAADALNDAKEKSLSLIDEAKEKVQFKEASSM